MALRGQRKRPRIDALFSAKSWEESRESRAAVDLSVLADPHAEFAVGLRLSDVAHWSQDGGHWWCSQDSWAYITEGTAYQWGPRDLATETGAAFQWWEGAGRPELPGGAPGFGRREGLAGPCGGAAGAGGAAGEAGAG
ncbi:hypothetical protein [Streptomyces cucumeris]|uniref:hypothetical protein n=1 Tax=Streptomyces cucumeris TaxID=2962890 RepID=UPI003D710DAD